MENKHLALDGDKLTLTGVTKVVGNNGKTIAVKQGNLLLTVCGDGLSVTEVNLETGRVAATGNVTSIKYSSETGGRDILKKLFK